MHQTLHDALLSDPQYRHAHIRQHIRTNTISAYRPRSGRLRRARLTPSAAGVWLDAYPAIYHTFPICM
jgi:hypothetical protein